MNVLIRKLKMIIFINNYIDFRDIIYHVIFDKSIYFLKEGKKTMISSNYIENNIELKSLSFH